MPAHPRMHNCKPCEVVTRRMQLRIIMMKVGSVNNKKLYARGLPHPGSKDPNTQKGGGAEVEG